MNPIFFIIFTLSVIFISFSSPDLVLKSITDGANKGILLSFNLLAIYSVWSGILEIAQNCGLNAKISKLLKPIINKLFKNISTQTEEEIAINLSANLLGMGGIATPSGIKATTMLTDNGNHDGACMLLVLASTSLQILPTTVISLRQSFNSISPFDIFIPSLLSTTLSTVLGIFLYKLTQKRIKIKRTSTKSVKQKACL